VGDEQKIMIKFEEALNIVLGSVITLTPEEVSIIDSLERVLAGDVYSDCDIPAFDYSAMDGFALRYEDTKGALPESCIRLEIVGEFRAGGDTSSKVGSGEAVRIMTGAPIPDGADAVIMVEKTKENDGIVEICEEVEAGDNIRLTGEDIKNGDLVIHKGTLLNSAHVGMFASLGISRVNVIKKPRVALLTTGDEVIGIDEEIRPGKVRNSNAYSLFCQVKKYGGAPVNMGTARDEKDSLRERLKSCLDCDLIITSGGVSMGEYDYVRDVMNEIGMEQKFWKVAMRPGKPNLFGLIDGKPFFGLPGNPVSGMVGFEVFIGPAIRKMLGQKDEEPEVDAILQEDIKKKKGLRFFIRAVTRWEGGRYVTKTTGPQGSGMLSSMVRANSLIILPEDEQLIKQGTMVKVRLL
jgi:molybdopterin molybdotransferase